MILLFLPDKLKLHLKGSPIIKGLLEAVFWVLILSTCHTIGCHYFEKVSWGEAWWQTWQGVTTVGYGNQPPETFWGRWNAAIFITGGMAFLGTLISVIFELKQNAQNKRRFGMTRNKFTNGYIIINFPGPTELAILANEIHAQEPSAGICVIDNKIEELPQSLITAMPNLSFIGGSLLDKQTYEMANIKENKIVMIFPENPNSSDSDASTKTIVDTVQKFIGDNTRILYVLVNPDNAWLFEGCKAKPVLQTMELFALVQESQDPGISQTIQKLLKNTDGAIPQTCKLTSFKGWSWSDFRIAFYQTVNDEGMRLDILALVQEDDPILLPFNDTVIGHGDLLQIVTPERIDWDALSKKVIANAA